MEDLRSSWEWMLNLEVLLMFDMIQSHPYFVPDIACASMDTAGIIEKRGSKTW